MSVRTVFIKLHLWVHTSEIYGWPTRIVYALASLSVVIQAVTGIIIWALRFFRKKSKAPAATADAVEVA